MAFLREALQDGWVAEGSLVVVRHELTVIKEKIKSLLMRLDKVMGLGETVGCISGMDSLVCNDFGAFVLEH